MRGVGCSFAAVRVRAWLRRAHTCAARCASRLLGPCDCAAVPRWGALGRIRPREGATRPPRRGMRWHAGLYALACAHMRQGAYPPPRGGVRACEIYVNYAR